jgi:hypothetical protein
MSSKKSQKNEPNSLERLSRQYFINIWDIVDEIPRENTEENDRIVVHYDRRFAEEHWTNYSTTETTNYY